MFLHLLKISKLDSMDYLELIPKSQPIRPKKSLKISASHCKPFCKTVAILKRWNSFLYLLHVAHHTACISFKIPKRQAISTEGVFSLVCLLWTEMEGCTNRAWPIQAESAWDIPYLNRKIFLHISLSGFLNQILFVNNLCYFVIRFLLDSSIVKSDKEVGKGNDKKMI